MKNISETMMRLLHDFEQIQKEAKGTGEAGGTGKVRTAGRCGASGNPHSLYDRMRTPSRMRSMFARLIQELTSTENQKKEIDR